MIFIIRNMRLLKGNTEHLDTKYAIVKREHRASRHIKKWSLTFYDHFQAESNKRTKKKISRSEEFHFGDLLMLLPYPCMAPHHPMSRTPPAFGIPSPASGIPPPVWYPTTYIWYPTIPVWYPICIWYCTT